MRIENTLLLNLNFNLHLVENWRKIAGLTNNQENPYRRDYCIAWITFITIAGCLYLDSISTPAQQLFYGVLGWALLFSLLYGECNAVRAQVMIAVAFATVGEHFASPFMGGYTYRFENVPLYVPPGHGMVYLTAVALARSGLFRVYRKEITVFVLTTGTLWSLWGITFAERGDWVGALLFSVFFIFIFVGRSPLVYLGAFFVTTWLELIGTYFGTWHWAVIDPVLDWPQGNPPSGVAAWYCWVDAVALSWAPKILRAGEWIRERYALQFEPKLLMHRVGLRLARIVTFLRI